MSATVIDITKLGFAPAILASSDDDEADNNDFGDDEEEDLDGFSVDGEEDDDEGEDEGDSSDEDDS